MHFNVKKNKFNLVFVNVTKKKINLDSLVKHYLDQLILVQLESSNLKR